MRIHCNYKFHLIKQLKGGLIGIISIIFIIYLLHPGRFPSSYIYVPESAVVSILHTNAMENDATICKVICNSFKAHDLSVTSEYNQSLYAALHNVNLGGWWSPHKCQSVIDVAIIVPYRKRSKQLAAFLHYMHPYLQDQSIRYRIIVVEQSWEKAFNRGMLMNIGFLEALKLHAFPCFVFHDVDLLPETLDNIYACAHQPRHMSASINVWRYNLLYNGAFGGVIAIRTDQFQMINGFSNVYYGWGAEDDDLLKRIKLNNLHIIRFSPRMSKYFMLPHKAEKKNPERFSKLQIAETRFRNDGLNSLAYEVTSYSAEPLFTKVTVKI